MDYDFEWDPAKAIDNISKHGVTFEEAATILLDPLALTVFDEAHSQDEERWFSIGQSVTGNLLVLVHTFDAHSPTHARIRVISARKPTPTERRSYEEEAQ
jgi:uncharacterized protein